MDCTPTSRGPWSRQAPWWLAPVAILVMTFLAAPAGAQPSPASSPCQPWGDETTEGADLWAAVAAEVPTFAGLYVNEDTRTLYVLLTDKGQTLEKAVHAIQMIIRSHVFCEFTPVARPVTYSYSQLKAWDDRLAEVMSIPGTVSSGIDEVNNRLEVGVEDLAEQGPQVEAKLAELGIPRKLVSIVKEGPFFLDIERRSPWPVLIVIGLALAVCVFVAARVTVRRRSNKDRSEVPVSGEGG
jgi:hypothetical protein